MTHARERRTSKNFVSSSHQGALLMQGSEPLSAVLDIALHEGQAGLLLRQGWRVDVDAQHAAKPEVLAHALVHHLLVHTAPSNVAWARAHRKIVICELTPDADHFDPFGVVSLDQKLVWHLIPAWKKNTKRSVHVSSGRSENK
jgi:hypothetical protein